MKPIQAIVAALERGQATLSCFCNSVWEKQMYPYRSHRYNKTGIQNKKIFDFKIKMEQYIKIPDSNELSGS